MFIIETDPAIPRLSSRLISNSSIILARNVKVFLSYRQTGNGNDPHHSEKVYAFGKRLVDGGIDVILDKFYVEKNPGGPNQWPKWCEDQVDQADKVIMIASVGYFRCYDQKEDPGVGLGAACETTVIRNALYKERYDSAKFRIAYFDEGFKESLPTILFSMPRFDVNDSVMFEQLVRWIKEAPPEVQRNEPIVWPTPCGQFDSELANRDVELKFVMDMLSGRTTERAILCSGPGNHGKSAFLFECIRYAKCVYPENRIIYVDFKPGLSHADFIDSLRLGLASYAPNFQQLHTTTFHLRSDLRNLRVPIVVILDTFEKASRETVAFLEVILADLDKFPAMSLLIAGQSCPNNQGTIWRSWSRQFEIGVIREPAPWRKYAQRYYTALPQDSVDLITYVTEGIPGVIRTMLHTASKMPRANE